MSWNTMMEGFRRHEGTTGQNPMEMAKQQNDAIKKSIQEVVGEENFEKRLEQIRQANEAKEREIEERKKELRDRRKFYESNAPSHVKQQIPKVFNELSEESRFEELDE